MSRSGFQVAKTRGTKLKEGIGTKTKVVSRAPRRVNCETRLDNYLERVRVEQRRFVKSSVYARVEEGRGCTCNAALPPGL